MLKRFMSLGLVANVLWVAVLVMTPQAATGVELFKEVITCIGFDIGGLDIGGEGPLFEGATVYVHNFGSTTATVTVRFASFNNIEQKVEVQTLDPLTTAAFGLSSAEFDNLAANFMGIAQVISDSKHLLVDAMETYSGSLEPPGRFGHRRHVGCGRTPHPPQLVAPPPLR